MSLFRGTADTTSSERSFSTPGRLKTWLRNSMTEKRSTHLSLMPVHQDILDDIDIQKLIKIFANTTAERQPVFGAI